ncbi:MAG: BBP7 family outer membrane beta-barrel protein [Planctomycetota bacterium]
MTKRAPALLLAALAAAVVLAGPGHAVAQQAGPFPVANAVYGGQAGGAGAVRAFHPGDPLVDAHGDPAVIPAQYCPPGGGGYGSGYGGGVGYGVDQVGPHYFDIAVEYLSLQRDSIFDGTVNFTSLGFNDTGVAPNIVLSSDDISGEYEPGFRITGRYDVGPLSVLEVAYTGLFDMNSSASFTDPAAVAGEVNALFSPFTNFGDGFLPDPAVDPLEGGFNPADLEEFEETDRATTHSLSYTSDLQSAEISYRRYWVGYSPRVTGTLLAGFRYTKLKESFRFNTVGNDFAPGTTQPDPPAAIVQPTGVGTSSTQLISDNDLAGFQMGGDMWVGIIQGLRVGAEGKVGLYNNHYTIENTFSTSDGSPAFTETARNDQAAFISEAKIMLVADVLPSLSVRGGYEVLFMNSLALVGDNFNTGSPYASALIPADSQRTAFLLDQGNALFHGWNIGFEYIW